MKLKKLLGNWSNAIKTFPISHILLLATSIIWIGCIQGSFGDHFAFRIIIAFSFAFLLSCLGPIFQIHSNLKNKATISRILQITALILGLIYYFILTKIKNVFNPTYSQGLLYFGILIITALSIPLLMSLLHKKQELKTRFSRESLIISIIFGAIAGGIVRGGIAGALGSIEALFDVNIDSKRYQYIGVVSEILLAGSFTFNYYLTLVENINKSEFKIENSLIRKIFGSFIFLPLALIYLLIFGAYGIKILFTGVRPNGIIIRLGIGYFLLGILSVYLIYPEKTKTHEIINKILYISFIMITLIMIGAISKRIQQHGITINRRFICYIIAFIILYSVLSLICSKKRLLVFISTLFILTILSLYGPLSSANISFNSQLNKLQTLLSKENISLPLGENSLKNLNEDSARNIISTIDELTDKYSKNKILDQIIPFDYSENSRYARSEIREYLGVDSNITYNDSPLYFNYRQNSYEYEAVDVFGFSRLYEIYKYEIGSNILKIDIDNDKYEIDLSEYIPQLLQKADLYKKSDKTKEEVFELNSPALVLNEENYRLIISGFHGEKEVSGKINISSVEGYFLIK